MAVTADNPIRTFDEDVLGRGPIARTLAAEIRSIDAAEGAVVAVMGGWGTGKTSLINLIRHELTQNPPIPILDFNPWLFSGTEQLVESFFVELASQLRLKSGGSLRKIAEEVEAYGELLSPLGLVPVVGAWVDRIGRVAGGLRRLHDRRKESVYARRERLADKLRELDRPLVVVIDDIDRLQTAEIRDIFKLVRLTASFPNIIYLLAFDRARVEAALSETGLIGRSYLEKIVQVSFDIPAIPEQLLMSQLTKTLAEALTGDAEPRRFDEERWPDVLMEIVWPLITNVRDVRRYVAGARETFRALGAGVEAVDLLGMEALRIFAPDAFAAIVDGQEALTTTFDFGLDNELSEHRQAVERLLEKTEPHEGLGRAILARLFPTALRFVNNVNYGHEWMNDWLRSRRVAHPDVLRLYLERVPNTGIAAMSDAERAFALLGDEDALNAYLRSIETDRLEDVIIALKVYEGVFPVEAIAPASVVLLNIIPIIPKRKEGFLASDPRAVVRYVVLRLLSQLGEPAKVEEVVLNVIPRLSTLSSRLQLLQAIGNRDDPSRPFVSKDFLERLRTELADAVGHTPPDGLAREWDVVRLLIYTHPEHPAGEPILETVDNPDLNSQILTLARADARSVVTGSRVVRSEPRLAWDALVKIYGDEGRIRCAVDSVDKGLDEGSELAETVALARRYLDGWRPPEP